jgi:glutathione peroxidase
MNQPNSIYDIKVKDINNNIISMSEYKGKTLLIVNVASKCGFANQYTDLERLYQKYKNNGLVILGFPCNQFANQEPGTNEDILAFCKNNFNITFPLFSKINVNGPNTSELYQYLKNKKPGFLWLKAIKWNFTKFIVDKHGYVVRRFSPFKKPHDIENIIVSYLK